MIDTPRDEPDYYAILRVAPSATPAEVERAYRQLAGKKLNARWRQGRAARELAQINAAYGVLRYAERRADYDRRRALAVAQGMELDSGNGRRSAEEHLALISYRRQRQSRLPRVSLGRTPGSNPAEAVIIVLVVLLAGFVAVTLGSRALVDLSPVQSLSETLGVTPRRRVPATPTLSQPPVAAEAKPSPAPAAPTPGQPLGALPTSVAAQRFAGSQVSVSEPRPPRNSNVTVTLKLVREGQPVRDANVYLTAHFRTLDERQPPDNSTVKTDGAGVAAITFNIGDATGNYQVNVDVTALVEGQQVVFQTSFTPR